MIPKSVGIVGGGMLGMTLALRLAQKGFQVTLMESTDTVGGLAAPCRIGRYTWDRFYHVLLLSDSHLLALIEELKLTDRLCWGRTRTGFYTDGHLYSMSNLFEFLNFPPLGLIDKCRLGWTIFYASKIKTGKHLEQIPVSEWLARHSGRRTFEKIWLPLLKSKLGDNYKIVNAAFIWAIIARMYAARRAGLKQEMFGYLDGGYATILPHLQRKLVESGVETLLNARVGAARRNGAAVEVEVPGKKLLDFHALVLTVPCPLVLRICPDFSPSEKARFNRLKYEGVICLALVVRKPLAGFYVTNITDPKIPFTAVIEITSLVERKYFDGNSLIYLPLYLDQGDDFWKKTDQEIEAIFLDAVGKMYKSFTSDDVVESRISRAPYVLPLTTLRYSEDLLPPTRTSVENIFIVNSAQIAHGTMNLNEIIYLAATKAREISDFLTT